MNPRVKSNNDHKTNTSVVEEFNESVRHRYQRQPTYVYNCNMFTDIIPNHIDKVHCNTVVLTLTRVQKETWYLI